MNNVEELLGVGDPLNRELGIRYITARIAGYVIEELYGFLGESTVVVCNEGTLREMIGSAPSEFMEELGEFLEGPSKGGMLRMLRYNREGLKMGWVNPPAGMEELIREKRAELGGRMIGREVGQC